jgi:hypothetical protein
MRNEDDLSTPSSRRTSAAKQQKLTARAAKLGVDLGPVLSGEQPTPSAPSPVSSKAPLGDALDDLVDAKRSVQAAGFDEAGTIRRIAARIRQKVAAMPAGMMEPMSDAEIGALVDQTIKQTLDQQRQRLTSNAMAALKMSATRAVVKALTADNQRRVESVQYARRLQSGSHNIGIAAVRCSNDVPMGKIPTLLEFHSRAGISFYS